MSRGHCHQTHSRSSHRSRRNSGSDRRLGARGLPWTPVEAEQGVGSCRPRASEDSRLGVRGFDDALPVRVDAPLGVDEQDVRVVGAVVVGAGRARCRA